MSTTQKVEVVFWGSIEGLELFENEKVTIGDKVFILPTDDVEDVVERQHKELFGLAAMNLLTSNPLLVAIKSVEEQGINKHLAKLQDYLFDFTTGLWFVKDNSVCIRQNFTRTSDFKHSTFGYNKGASNAKGHHENTTFTSAEILQSILVMDKLAEVTPAPNSVEKISDKMFSEDEVKKRGLNSNHLLDYDFPRITRAYFMLSQARSTTAPAIKIAFYMSTFECLFSDGGSDAINYKLSQRIAFFLTTDKMERLKIKSSIKEAYQVRSSYIHGAEIPKQLRKHEKLILISEAIDNLLRKSFLKAIFNHGDKFSLSNDQFGKWLEEEIIYG
ncbi:MAG TPA: hypothetical protein VGN64_05695 [Dyadobacter sp.]|jgi:hypothetical protein|nr:hypothetical protein [Dyadobacter sp.]